MAIAKISGRGSLLISIELRKKYGLQKGSRVMVVDYGNVLAIVPTFSNPIEQSRGMLKGGKRLLEALKEERGREVE